MPEQATATPQLPVFSQKGSAIQSPRPANSHTHRSACHLGAPTAIVRHIWKPAPNDTRHPPSRFELFQWIPDKAPKAQAQDSPTWFSPRFRWQALYWPRRRPNDVASVRAAHGGVHESAMADGPAVWQGLVHESAQLLQAVPPRFLSALNRRPARHPYAAEQADRV